jgi:hypothetical protein
MPLKTLAPAALVAILVLAPVADAKSPAKKPARCDYTGTPVFAPWNDDRDYTLVAGGDFEDGAAGWSFDGDAGVVDGNETFQVGGPDDASSLGLPAGSSATSAPVCVSKGARVLRMFARTDGGRAARLRVDVIYPSGATEEVAELRAEGDWAPTRKLGLSLEQAGASDVTLRFTPVGAPAAWQVDDVFVDPRLRH